MGRKDADVHGVLVIDKPRGPTSHDVVARVRRALGTRAVGHAGTLDPMATGVLVVAVGEATKLVRWLTEDAKSYRATVALGVETDTLDAEGQAVERAPIPASLTLERARAVASERFSGTITQRPPAFSAIKVGGRPLHERARRGEVVEVPEREVTVHRLEVLALEAGALELSMDVSKGFYVRSLARDLARALETRGHLSALRRTRSGSFELAGALEGARLWLAASGDEAAREEVRAALVSPAAACAGMERVVLDAEGVSNARHGRPIDAAHSGAPLGAPLALFDESERLIAIGVGRGSLIQVVRGLRS